MINVKVMPASEKYASTLDYIKHESIAPSFIHDRLGGRAAAEYNKVFETSLAKP